MTTPLPKHIRDIQAAELDRVFGKLVFGRLWAAPLFTGLAVWLAVVEPAPWRKILFVAGGLGIVVISALELRRYRRSGFDRTSIPFNLGLAVFGQLLVAFASGGLESPVVLLLLPIALFNGLLVEPIAVRLSFAGVQLAAIWAFAATEIFGWMPDLTLQLFGGARAGHNDAWVLTMGFVATAVVVIANTVGRGLRGVFRSVLARAAEAREESLQTQAERSRDLTALAGEIAHELKNPMASAKGLAALLVRDVPDGKGSERLGVLRREIDRMQEILDEFLNFSRPLVPLSLAEADLSALCREVAVLHEGMSHEKNVTLEVKGAAAAVRCDPRKVKQVLINLVQNAIEASRPGGAIEIEIEEQGGGARVLVLDRGGGIAPAVAERVFEPGVTTKPKGSGLGLTIARALARQHGGDVVLDSRDGGGCAAQLTLPKAPRSMPAVAGGAP